MYYNYDPVYYQHQYLKYGNNQYKNNDYDILNGVNQCKIKKF
jgi:hypothetical protein